MYKLLWAVLLTQVVQAPAAGGGRPNIVLILADDMGFSDIGCYGGEISTPNLDRLAAGGLRFTQFYNNARCCPTRASLLTGLYPHQAGIGHMNEDRGLPGYRGRLNDQCVTIAEALRAAGYRTLMSGKWHVGLKRPQWPVDRGFDRSFSLIGHAMNYFRLHKGATLTLDGKPWRPPEEGFYLTDAIGDHAAGFLDEARDKGKPFFLYLAFSAPHWPLHARPEDIEKYRGKYRDGWDALRERRHRRMIELGLVDKSWPLAPRDPSAPAWDSVPDKEDRDLRMAVYAAQVDRMDRTIGRVLARLKETGASDNTLVLFLADNGACAEEIRLSSDPKAPIGTAGSFESYGLPWANASNTPFRLFKHWVHEGGISTPLIASWPGVIRPGGVTKEPGHVIDLMATCLDAAGAPYPKTATPLEGKSLVPVFKTGTRAGHEAIFWEHEGNRAVRQGRWKLVAEDGKDWELYDLEADRTESKDLAASRPELVRELAAKHDAWASRVGVAPWKEVEGRK